MMELIDYYIIFFQSINQIYWIKEYGVWINYTFIFYNLKKNKNYKKLFSIK